MCGIVGYVGDEQATGFLLDGLKRLEYRGYDSSGIAVFDGKVIDVEKTVGKLDALMLKVEGNPPPGVLGIGHTRWATHGRPSDSNSHPHLSDDKKFAVVHNGIIENYLELKEELVKKGYTFASETDTEVVAQLMQEHYNGDFLATVKKVLTIIEGSYALVFMTSYAPDQLICAKKDNPLVVGLGEGANYIASDIPAIISRTRRTYILSDGEIAIVKKDSVRVENRKGQVVDKKEFHVKWDAQAAEKGGYEHFMLKEIHDQPEAFCDTMRGRLAKNGQAVKFNELSWSKEDISSIKKIFIVACGTAYHAGMVGNKYFYSNTRQYF